MRFRRPVWMVGVGALAVVAAACGGSSPGGGTGASGTAGDGAKYAPASSIVFFDANVDQGSTAWKKLIALGTKFPSWQKLVAQVDKGLADTSGGKGSYNTMIKPWLGGEVSLAVTHLDASSLSASSASGASGDAKIVAYAQSTDDKKATSALQSELTKTGTSGDFTLYRSKKGGGDSSSPGYVAIGKGAVLLSNSQTDLQSAIAAGTGKADSLQSAKDFKSSMDQLPSDNLLVGYVNTPALKPLLQAASGQEKALPTAATAQLQAQLAKLGDAGGAAFAATPSDNGIHFASFSQTADASTAAMLAKEKTTLGDRVPSNALAFVGFHDLGPTLERAIESYSQQDPQVAQQIAQGEAALGVSIKNDVVPLLTGEHALFVAGGAPPTVTLLLKPADAAKGADTLTRLTKLLGSQTGLQFTGDANGQQAKQGSNTFAWHRSGDVIALSNDPQAGGVQGSGLFSSDKFTQLQKAAGAPDSSTASMYLDVPSLVTLAQATSGSDTKSASSQEATANLQHIGGLLGWTSVDGKKVESDLFLQVK